ncbi:MAG: hypothetical protein Q7J98_04905, partial [Kiritimatiellia bacterium]|nr:hypothetical protein [Kiritimatiellia bacterium]
CLDNGNAVPIMEDPYDDVKKLAPYAFAVHFKDYAILDTSKTPWGAKIVGVPYGQGVFDLPRMWKTIKDKAPNPNITIECTLEPKGTVAESLKYEDESVRECVRYAREVLNIR